MMCTALTKITLTNGLTVIGVQMFQMEENALKGASLQTITIPSTVTSIGEWFTDIIYSIRRYYIFFINYY